MASIVDPDLIANIVQQLNVKGALSPFEISEIAVPVFDIGRLAGLTGVQKIATPGSDVAVRVGTSSDTITVATSLPRVAAASMFDSGAIVNAGAAADILDTGQLAAGLHLVQVTMSTDTAIFFQLQWRNAADAANNATFTFVAIPGGVMKLNFMVTLVLNERFKVINGGGAVVGASAATIIAAPVSVSIA